MILNVLYISIAFVCLFLPVAASWWVKIPGVSNFIKVISIYGVYVFAYMIIQIIFSILNRKKMERLIANSDTLPISSKFYDVIIVGYREDPEMFMECLKSHLKNKRNPRIRRTIVVVDGNSAEDMYMVNIFQKIFKHDGEVSYIPSDFDPEAKRKFLCISQPHGGKRECLSTGISIAIADKVNGFICTDSDTEMDKNAVDILIKTLESDPKIGAVTGDMKISNPNSIISVMSFIRYWFACNLERAYQSYNECVLCVSGPIGIYRTEVVEPILFAFVNQTFMGQKCTYGDDRHLTNNILLAGYKVLYNHLAFCKTDTPEEVSRFFNQQVRWCKSSYREILWNIKAVSMHSIWMSVDLIYTMFYSFVVLAGFLYSLFSGLKVFSIYLFVLIAVNSLKGLLAFVYERNIIYLLYSMYGFVYIYIVVPAKVFAGFTMKDIAWGTSTRDTRKVMVSFGEICMYLWVVFVNAYFFWIIYLSRNTPQNYILLSVLFGFMLLNLLLIKTFAMGYLQV